MHTRCRGSMMYWQHCKARDALAFVQTICFIPPFATVNVKRPHCFWVYLDLESIEAPEGQREDSSIYIYIYIYIYIQCASAVAATVPFN